MNLSLKKKKFSLNKVKLCYLLGSIMDEEDSSRNEESEFNFNNLDYLKNFILPVKLDGEI